MELKSGRFRSFDVADAPGKRDRQPSNPQFLFSTKYMPYVAFDHARGDQGGESSSGSDDGLFAAKLVRREDHPEPQTSSPFFSPEPRTPFNSLLHMGETTTEPETYLEEGKQDRARVVDRMGSDPIETKEASSLLDRRDGKEAPSAPFERLSKRRGPKVSEHPPIRGKSDFLRGVWRAHQLADELEEKQQRLDQAHKEMGLKQVLPNYLDGETAPSFEEWSGDGLPNRLR